MNWEKDFRNIVNAAPGKTISNKLEYIADFIEIMIEEEKAKKHKSESTRSEEAMLIKIHNNMVRDFNSNQTRHSNWTTIVGGKSHFHYSFQNGDLLDLDEDGKLYLTRVGRGTTTYILDVISANIKSKFTNTTNAIKNKKQEKKQETKYSWRDFGKAFEYLDEDDEDYFWKEFHNKYSDFSNIYGNNSSTFDKNHPKREVYDTLLATIKSRKEHLSNLAMNHPDRISLQNELNVAISKMEDMKKKYNF
jgi:hypothetical protein